MKLSQYAKTTIKCFLIFVIAVNLFGYVLPLIRNGATTEGFKGRKSLLLLHMEGCGHCEKLMPEWDKFNQHSLDLLICPDLKMITYKREKENKLRMD